MVRLTRSGGWSWLSRRRVYFQHFSEGCGLRILGVEISEPEVSGDVAGAFERERARHGVDVINRHVPQDRIDDQQDMPRFIERERPNAHLLGGVLDRSAGRAGKGQGADSHRDRCGHERPRRSSHTASVVGLRVPHSVGTVGSRCLNQQDRSAPMALLTCPACAVASWKILQGDLGARVDLANCFDSTSGARRADSRECSGGLRRGRTPGHPVGGAAPCRDSTPSQPR